jgi:hypothetical protein
VNEAFRVNAVFGIELPASLQDMTELIGLRTGHAVRFYKTTNPNAYEECGIENHVPSIGLRDPDGIDLYNIAHGLFHLRCRIRGFPKTITKFSANDQFLVLNASSDLQSLIEHQIIYPELEGAGFQPRSETEQIVLNTFKPDKFTKKIRKRPEVRCQLALIYARVLLEVPSGETASKAEAWFASVEKEARRIGRKIVSKIRNADLTSPEGYKKVFDECAALLGIPAKDYGWTSGL